MLNGQDVFVVSREGYQLMQLEGNCGRKLRRFVKRILGDANVGNLLIQSLDNGELVELESSVYQSMTAYAERLQQANAQYLVEDVQDMGISADQGLGLVGVAYRLMLDIDTATVKQLKTAVRNIVVLADNMQRYCASPETALAQI